jgi:hypothetical protein
MRLFYTHVEALQQLLASPVTFERGNPVSQIEIEVDCLLIRRIVKDGCTKLEFVSCGQGHWNTVLQYYRWYGCTLGTIEYQHTGSCRFSDPLGQEAELAKALADTLTSEGYRAKPYYNDIVKNGSRADWWQGPTVKC